jgi:hypothetical protein
VERPKRGSLLGRFDLRKGYFRWGHYEHASRME